MNILRQFFNIFQQKISTETGRYSESSLSADRVSSTEKKEADQQFHEHKKLIKNGIVKEQVYCGPDIVQIDITNVCNNSCIGCWFYSPYLSRQRKRSLALKDRLPLENVMRTIEDLNRLGTKRILLSGGGDPMMHPDFEEIIHLICTKRMECNFMTNLTTANKKLIDRVIELQVSEMFVSLWAATPDTYKKTHPNQNIKQFHHITKMLKYAVRKKKRTPMIVIANTISKANYNEILDMAKLASKIGVERVEFVTMDLLEETAFLRMGSKELAIVKEQISVIEKNSSNGFLNRVRDNRFKSKTGSTELWGFDRFKKRIFDYKNPKGFDARLVDSIPCYVGWTYARIMACGNVIPCCRGSKLPLGNINKTSFKEIWLNAPYNHFRKMAIHEKKSHPYFSGIDCYSGCDNYTENKIWNDALSGHDD